MAATGRSHWGRGDRAIDDIMNIRSTGGVAGMSAKVKFSLYSILLLIGGWWFYAKLGVHSVYLPWMLITSGMSAYL